ncbi:unnamed protein product [Tilletia controversa]|uniref:Uncharacterized protein n=3 Tax=Tilletia TaxID=13289 RepID=A0A8X7MHG6_9BASI|nr:hypothetical protein CF336_g9500 [Tilletia laevis]KAE8235324.1 hypothetical protein A4X06_0g9895 [Tilletia controversa]KAE8235333.1 hypothetical protein A4X03_0g9820 [Tilletia caries]KAE8180116.1 hypothetical protein CF335_g9355 [Tilletia laevis]CAD6891826.1 unnamed protein product [Tilletia caries]
MSTAVATPSQSQPTTIVRWDRNDTLNFSTDLLNLFATVSGAVPVAGSILSPVLSGIKEICISVKEVEENREAAEDLAKKILRMVVRIIDTMNAANVVPSTGSPFTETMTELNM